MYLPKIREIKEALSSFFTKPYTSKFPKEPFKAAEEYRGKPRYDGVFCIGCGTCAQVCPAQAIEIIDNKELLKRTLTVSYLSCINCGQCEENCITGKGIKMTNEYSFAVMDKTDPKNFESVEKEIVLCEICGEVIAPRDHLLWVKERLGAKAYAHPNFLLEEQKAIFEAAPSIPKSRIRREDQIKELCSKCRHKVVVEDEFYTVH
ncbi:MAG TPA: 4Fe-4S dicluster domain-containing protein [Ignavibacteriaceae bacterium]|nr:4Fe-4S dicluster domain-containing protein [Ignavibacteriaceae bacterium]